MFADADPLSPPALQDMMEKIAALALKAGAAILEIYAGDFAVSSKADRSPVTEADARAEAIIIDGLRAIAPGIPVISEEAFSGDTSSADAEAFFLVDPLDGTKEFVRRNGEFTVNIGLVYKRRPIAGVVYAPALSRCFLASGPDRSSSFVARSGDLLPGPGARQRLSVRRAPTEGLTALVTRSHGSSATDEYLRQYSIAQRIAMGSSLKICLVAAGEADLSPRFGPTMEWDTAAAHAIAAGAGAKLIDVTSGQTLTYGKRHSGLTNPNFVVLGDCHLDPENKVLT